MSPAVASPHRTVSVFYCFSHEDRAFQQELELHLAGLRHRKEIKTWGYDTGILPGADWRKCIEQQLNTAEIVLLLLSPDFLNSDFCCYEMERALARSQAQEAAVIPILLRPCLWNDSPIQHLQHLPPGNRAISECRNRDGAWARVVESLKKVVAEVAARPILPSTIPGYQLPRALQRPDVLAAVHARFHHQPPQRVVCMHGGPALGKTRMAIQYAHNYRDEYRAQFFISAHDKVSIRRGLYDIAIRGLELVLPDPSNQEQGAAAAQSWLDSHDGWLLILDDATPAALAGWPLPEGKGHILITTLDDQLGLLPPPATIAVRRLTPDEALAYFRESMSCQLTVAEENEAYELARELDYLPMALQYAASFIAQQAGGMSLAAYRLRLHAPQEAGEELPVLDLCLDEAQSEGGVTRELLRLSAFLDGKRIPMDLFARDAARSLGPPLDTLCTPEAVYQALAPLVRYSLISLDAVHGSYGMNWLVQRVVSARMSEEARRRCAEQVVRLVSSSVASLEYKDWPKHQDLAPQVLAALELINGRGIRTAPALGLLNKAGGHLIEQGRYGTACGCYEKALAIWDEALRPQEKEQSANRLARAETLNGLGRALYHKGRGQEAEQYFLQALALRREAAGPEHLDTATSMNNLALLYYHMDPHRPGLEELLREALRIREKELGGLHPFVAKTLNNLALYLSVHGRHQEALALHLRALHLRLLLLDPGHHDVAQSLVGIAQLDAARGDYDEAEAGYRRSRKLAEQALGKNHPNVGFSILGLAQLHTIRRQDAWAEEGYKEALRIWAPLGDEHPCVARCYFGLGVLHDLRGDWQEAISSYQRALGIWRTTLAEQHPDRQECTRRLAALLEKCARESD